LNKKTKEDAETPLFFAMKYIKSKIEKKLMVQSLINLGANPGISKFYYNISKHSQQLYFF